MSGSHMRGTRLAPLAGALALLALAPASRAQERSPSGADDPVSRGRYLAIMGGCGDCHTSTAGAYAGGRPLSAGLGTVVSANITPDPKTGIGAWSADDFYRALHSGVSRKVGHLYPAFPYPHFTKITRADSDALYAYLRSQPAVRNDPHRDQLSFPLNIRAIMAIWNGLYFREGTFRPDAAHAADWNRGAYVVQALAHCGACHSPKNALQAEVAGRAFQGGDVEGWFAPNLTPEPRTGLGAWSPQDLVDFLKTGRNRFTAAGGPMAGVIAGSTSKMDDTDLAAIAAYITSLPASPAPTPRAVDAAVLARGRATFETQCSACHGEGAVGRSGRNTPLEGSALVQSADPATIVRYILNGTKTAVTPAHPTPDAMPPFAGKLDDAQLAEVASYIRNAWGNRAAGVTARQVAKVRAKAKPPAGGG